MGREVKRVALDFVWPKDKVWAGFLNPHYEKSAACNNCLGTGSNKVGRFLSDTWYQHLAREMFGAFFGDNILSAKSRGWLEKAGWSEQVCDNIDMAKQFGFKTLAHWSDKLVQEEVDALVEDDRLHDLTHVWKDGEWQPTGNTNPTPDDVTKWASHAMGHDSINQWICVKARAKRFGIENTVCEHCKGDGRSWPSEEDKVAYEEWEEHEPPKGEGWQMWETTSEGSPISPVFATPEKLARWLADTGGSTFGGMTTGYETWLKMITGSGYALSAVSGPDGVKSGVEFEGGE